MILACIKLFLLELQKKGKHREIKVINMQFKLEELIA